MTCPPAPQRPSRPTRQGADRRAAIVAFVASFHTAHGYSPTVREVGEAVGLVSPSSVAWHLKELLRTGKLRQDPGRPRALAPAHVCARCGSTSCCARTEGGTP